MVKFFPSLFLLVIFCFSENVFSQTGFENLYGGANPETGQSVWATSDGGYLIGGTTNSYGTGTPTNGNFYMVKTDGNGAQQWQKFYGFSGNDIGGKAFELIGGGYVIAGSALNPGTGNYDVYVVKTDASGTTVWSNFYDGGINSTDVCYDAIPLSGGGILIAGSSDTTGNNFDMFMMKINSAGVAQWKRHYGTVNSEVANAVKHTADNGFILCGYSNPTGFSVYDMYVVKTDSTGHMTWQNYYGGAYSDFAEDIIQLSDGSYTMVGNIHNYVDSSQAFMLHLNSGGTQQWIKNIGRSTGDEVYSVAKIGGGYVCAGYTLSQAAGGNVLLVKTNNTGDTVYTKQFGSGSDDIGNWIIAKPANYIIGGTTFGFGDGNVQQYLIKCDTLGAVPCPSTATFTTSPSSICEDNLVQFTNTTVSSVPFTWKINNVVFASGINAFHTFNAPGNYQIDLNCCGTSHLDTITVNAKPATNFSYNVTGHTVDFTMASGLNAQSFSWNLGDGSALNTTQQNPSHTYANLGSYWVILSVTNTAGCDSTITSHVHLIPNSVDENNDDFAVSIYPNPANDELNVICYSLVGRNKISIYDIFGKEIFSEVTSAENYQLSTGNYSDGIYFLSIENNNGKKVMKKFLVHHN